MQHWRPRSSINDTITCANLQIIFASGWVIRYHCGNRFCIDEDKVMAPLDDNENNPVRLWAEIHKLRAEAKGPDGFDTWRDAAIHQRVRASKAEEELKAVGVRVNRGALQTAINMLKRDAEEGFKVRGELAEELENSIK
jgi:hypothetical protein